MKIETGKTISEGIALGRVRYIEWENEVIISGKSGEKKGWQQFLEAKDTAISQLKEMQEVLSNKFDEQTEAGFLDIQISFLENPGLINMVKNKIEEGLDAVEAANKVCENYVQRFRGLDNDYMRERAKDIEDTFNRVRSILLGVQTSLNMTEPAVIACMDLSPSETAELDPDKVLGIIAQKSTMYSHMAIMARMLGIPTVTGVDVKIFKQIETGRVIVDGKDGKVYIDPDDETLNFYKSKKAEETRRMEKLKALLYRPACTKSGIEIGLYANVAGEEELKHVMKNNADGIGLMRSEFIYMRSDTYPTEEQLFEIYKHVLSEMKGKKVVVRTVDIGADKAVDYFGLEPEENPAMGYRGIRICLDRTDIFKVQLRALLRASKYGNLAIMFPMISDISEVRKCRELIEEVKQEVASAPFEIGIMIETPAAALISDRLAKEVDFFSIGTNDLLQFTLAVDRMNEKLDGTYDRKHPALLMLIEMSVKAAKKEGIWVGICGELAVEKSLTEWFVRKGVDELSVSASQILELKERICEMD